MDRARHLNARSGFDRNRILEKKCGYTTENNEKHEHRRGRQEHGSALSRRGNRTGETIWLPFPSVCFDWHDQRGIGKAQRAAVRRRRGRPERLDPERLRHLADCARPNPARRRDDRKHAEGHASGKNTRARLFADVACLDVARDLRPNIQRETSVPTAEEHAQLEAVDLTLAGDK